MNYLNIPQSEKDKGMIWVVYPVCYAEPQFMCIPEFKELYKIDGEVELKIQQEKN